MDDLVVWLRQQLDEDERVARAAGEGDWAAWEHTGEVVAAPLGFGKICQGVWGDLGERGDHIARHDPARVLRDVARDRLILDEYRKALDRRAQHPGDVASAGALLALLRVMELLALPYSDRPGYREEWKP
jgi:hypothetical protein